MLFSSVPKERIILLNPKSVLDELPPEFTDVESRDNVIQRYSKRPRQLRKLCLAYCVSKIDIFILKEISSQRNTMKVIMMTVVK